MNHKLRTAIVLIVAISAAGAARAAANKDFAGQALDGQDYHDGGLNKAKFDGASLKGASFRNATCKGASFRDAKLAGANFEQANLEGADFTGADLTGATFRDAKAWDAKMAGVTLPLTVPPPDFSKVNDFRAQQTLIANARTGAGELSLHRADLHNAKLLGDATGVDLRGADLRGADLKKVEHLDKARLGHAKYDADTQWPGGKAFDAKQAGAELATADDPTANKPAPAAAANGPLIGKWLILKGEGNAPDNGVLRLRADHTFDWDPALSADKPHVLTGTWAESGETAAIKGGELGQAWTVTPVQRQGKVELHLKSDQGVERVGVAE